MTEPRLVMFGTLGTGKAAHLLVRVDRDRRVGRTLCGLDGDIITVTEADERADRVDRGAVCGNCRDRLTASGGSGIVQVQPTRRRPTVATSTDRKKAPSAPLLDLNAYADQTLERLEQERTTINNRLSGLGTQIKRHTAAGETDKANAAIARRDDLVASRTILADAIALKKAGKTERPSEAAMRESTTKATTRRTSGAKTSSRKKTAAKKTTARKTAGRKTAAKKTGARKATARR